MTPNIDTNIAINIDVTVRYFASIREALGTGSENISVPQGSTLEQLRQLLIQRSSAAAEALSHQRPVRTAINQSMCQDETSILASGDEVAFFPPVTGG